MWFVSLSESDALVAAGVICGYDVLPPCVWLMQHRHEEVVYLYLSILTKPTSVKPI